MRFQSLAECGQQLSRRDIGRHAATTSWAVQVIILLYSPTPWWSVAVLTIWCQTSLSLAFLQAVWTPKFKDWRSSSIVLSQVVLRRHTTGLLQSAGGLSAAAMTRWWSSLGAVRARCPKKLSRSDLFQPDTGEQAVMLHTVSLVVCLVYGIRKIFRRHQVSEASRTKRIVFAIVLVTAHVSRQYSRTGSM